MKNRFLCLLVVFLLIALPACAEGVTVTDMTGREIRLDAPATRVVALTAADCEILFAIGAGETLVGRGEYCDYPPEVLSAPSVESGYETNVEQIIALSPQVVLMNTMAQPLETLNALESAGIRVIESVANDLAGVYRAIEMIGEAVGREEAARALAQDMKNSLAALAEGMPDGGKSVYFEVSPLVWGLWTAGEGTFMNEIAGMLGLVNCFSDVTGWAEISEEQVIARNPDYIVTITAAFGDGPSPAEEIMSRPGWQDVTAVKNGAILNLVNDELSRPSPRLVEGASALAEFITK